MTGLLTIYIGVHGFRGSGFRVTFRAQILLNGYHSTNTVALLSIQVGDLLQNFCKDFLGGGGGKDSSGMTVGGLGALAGALLAAAGVLQKAPSAAE